MRHLKLWICFVRQTNMLNVLVSPLHLKRFAAKLFLVNMEHIGIGYEGRVVSKYYCRDDLGCME